MRLLKDYIVSMTRWVGYELSKRLDKMPDPNFWLLLVMAFAVIATGSYAVLSTLLKALRTLLSAVV
jgi:hypothetical protein